MPYQSATLYFFSGTGNSHRVAQWIGAAARAQGAAVQVAPIAAARPADEVGDGPGALLGLVTPTHGFSAPWSMVRFALHLPRRRGTHAVAVATRAGVRVGRWVMPGMEGTAAYLLALILALKGYRVRGVTGIDMPSNWLALHPGMTPDTVQFIIERAEPQVAAFSAAVLAGGRRLAHWFELLLGSLFFPVSIAYMLLGRRFLSKLFFASQRCNGCGLCARHCPAGAIQMRGRGPRCRPYWTLRCESCQRCIAFCPQQAVESGLLCAAALCVGAVLLVTPALVSWIAARVPALAVLSAGPARLAFESFYLLAALYLGYPLLDLLLRVPPVNRLLTALTPTHYYRRHHEPGTRIDEI